MVAVEAGAQPGGGAQGARAPPLSCRAMTSYERYRATHVVTLASWKLEFSVRASSSCYNISCSTQKSATRLYTSHVPCAQEGPRASQRPIFQRSLISGCDLRTPA